jgi:hypothetical protein
MVTDKYTIIRDTREKNGWSFDFYENCEAVVDEGMKTGDYTVKGLEDCLVIERKASSGEVALNLGKKRKQFEAELERMEEFRFKYIVCEFSEDVLMQFPEGSTIPKYKWQYLRMNGKFMRKLLYGYEKKYGVTLIFAETKEDAEEVAIGLITEAYNVLKQEE